MAFYPAVDGRLLYVGIAIVALIVIAATKGRLGYRADQPETNHELPAPAAAHA